MSRKNRPSHIQDCFSQVEATAQLLNDLISHFLQAGSYEANIEGSGPYQREEFRMKIREMRRLLRQALGNGVAEDIFTALDALVKRRYEFERAFVVWVDLIEVLTQHAEQRFGPAAGLGEFKRDEVKEVFRRLLENSAFRIPNVPDYLRPLLIDVFLTWLIDTVVIVSNHYGLWKETEQRGRGFLLFRVRLKKAFLRILKPIGHAIARIFVAIWVSLRRRTTLSGAVLDAVRNVEREGIIISEQGLIHSLITLIEWIGAHRNELIASIELVFAAVQEAESYLSLSGPEKKAYARDLVLAVLDELGFITRVGLLFAVIDSLISGTIESAVHLFNKREVFVHKGSL